MASVHIGIPTKTARLVLSWLAHGKDQNIIQSAMMYLLTLTR